MIAALIEIRLLIVECVECVGCSNNTIRAALTNKHKDLEILCETLNYRMTDPEYYMIRPKKFPTDENIDVYDPEDCPDFALHQIKVSFIYRVHSDKL